MNREASRMGSVHPGTGADIDEVVEFATFIRDRPVVCRWAAGEVTGDPELLERLSYFVAAGGWTEHPSSVARAISAAVGSRVTIRVVDDADVDLSDHLGLSVPSDLRDLMTDMDVETTSGTDADVLGDYWLG